MNEVAVGTSEHDKKVDRPTELEKNLHLGWYTNKLGQPYFRLVRGQPIEELNWSYGFATKNRLVPVLDCPTGDKYDIDRAITPGDLESGLPEGIITIRAKDLKAHTLIVAQSGSGKSFFLGRLIEEILVKTRARCVIFDPNGDFRFSNVVRGEKWWTDARLVPKQDNSDGCNWLPTDVSGEFANKWRQVRIQFFPDPIFEAPSDEAIPAAIKNTPEIALPWELLDVSLLAPPGEPLAESQLRFAAKIVGLLNPLAGLWDRSSANEKRRTVLDLAKRLVASDLSSEEAFRESWMKLDSHVHQLAKSKGVTANWDQRDRVGDAVTAWRYSSSEALKLFVSALEEGSRVLDFSFSIGPYINPKIDLAVLDLAAIDEGRGYDSQRLMAAQCFLRALWSDAYESWREAVPDLDEAHARVPIFIVVDEAHNLISARGSLSKPASVVRDWFRRLAAEGRKFGIFLILVTQRPEKLDPLVASECSNRAIMRLSGKEALTNTLKLMEIPEIDEDTLQRILKFKTGRFFLCGSWAEREASSLDGFLKESLGYRQPQTQSRASRDNSQPETSQAEETVARTANSLEVVETERKAEPFGIFGYSAGRRTLEGGADIPGKWTNMRRNIERIAHAAGGN